VSRRSRSPGASARRRPSSATAPSGRRPTPSAAAPSGRLVVCPTPIGNLEDVTLRVLSALREADIVACEDTRRTRVLLDRYGVKARLVSYHEHNEDRRASELVARVREGETVALVSDAGTPLVSDPGYVLVRACVAAGLPVEVLPGPSAALTALVASGLPADEWAFAGFLPRKRGELRRALAAQSGTLVAFESPRRLPGTLAALAELDPDREVAVCRELTKAHEEVVRGTASELAARYAGKPPKGEIVLVLGPPPTAAGGAPDPTAVDALRRLIDAGAQPRKAAAVVADLTGAAANDLYRSLTSPQGRASPFR
jgi:16S rRNA (cytidine1402-2'-O)-methyltransferase